MPRVRLRDLSSLTPTPDHLRHRGDDAPVELLGAETAIGLVIEQATDPALNRPT